MRICLLLPDSLEQPSGGLGEQCRNILKCIAEMDSRVCFDVVSADDYTTAEDENTVSNFGNSAVVPCDEVHLPLGNQSTFARIVLRQLPYFATAITRPRADLVHALDWSTFTAGIYLSRHWGVPLVVSMNLSFQKLIEDRVIAAEADPTFSSINCAIELQGMIQAKAIIHVSQHYAGRFPFIFDSKAFVIGNGIDLREWENFEPYSLPGSSRLKVVYIGRFDAMKNITALLDADLPEEIDLIFVGGLRGGLSDVHERVVAAANDRANVHYLGPKYGREKVNLLRSADAVVMPSIHEPFGIVALEALASRSILLSSFRGGMAEFLTEDAAINCGVTPESISNALATFVAMSEDERLSRIEAGLNICRANSWEACARKVHAVYTKVLYDAGLAEGFESVREICGEPVSVGLDS